MAINFPNNPAVNDTFTVSGTTFTFTGVKWESSAVVELSSDTTPSLGGDLDGGAKNINNVGVITATGLDINGDADISGNLSVQGTTTTIDTAITEVDSLNVEGSVGIGTTIPGAKLEVRSDDASGIIIRSNNTQATDTNKALRVRNNSDTNTFHVSHKGQGYFAGRIGIGTAVPTTNFHNYNEGDVTILNDAVGGDATIDIRNSGNNNWSGIDFIRERSTGTNVTGGSIFMPSITANNSALLYIQTQTASAQSGVTGALTDNNGVRLKLASQPDGVGADSAFSVEVGSAERLRIDSGGTLYSYSPDDTTPNFKFRSNDTNWHGALNQSVHGATITTFLSCGGDWDANGTTYNCTKNLAAYPSSAIAVHNQYNNSFESKFVFLTKAGGSTTTDGGVTELASISSAGVISDSIGPLRRLDIVSSSVDLTLSAASHAGRLIRMTSTNRTFTIPSGSFSSGDMITIFHVGTGNMTIAEGSSVTLYNAADGATGNRTLAAKGMVTIVCTDGASNEFVISGSQLS